MPKPTLNDGTLIWCGEHWINALSDDGRDQPAAWFSLYHTRYSEAGEGNTLQLVIPSAGIRTVCTDNPQLGKWVANRFFSQSSVQTPDVPIEPGSFQRHGSTHDAPSWTIEWAEHRIEARWTITEAPVIAYGPFGTSVEFFTVLFFTMESALELDGRVLPGRPYRRDVWERTIGGERSSSLIALNESLIHPKM
jgi:hypothetical protein